MIMLGKGTHTQNLVTVELLGTFRCSANDYFLVFLPDAIFEQAYRRDC